MSSSEAIRALSVLPCNPALGGGSSVSGSQLAELMECLAEKCDEEGYCEDFTEIVESLATQGRQPTSEEWDVIRGCVAVDPEPAPEPEPEPEPTPEPEPEEEEEEFVPVDRGGNPLDDPE